MLLMLMFSSAIADAEIKVQLATDGNKSHFHSGERIVLDLSFIADTPGIVLNASNYNQPSSNDTVVLNSTRGVFPWYVDEARDHPYRPDYSMTTTLDPGKPAVVKLVLTDLFRFDQAGAYSVHVVTNRTGAECISNDVGFTVEPFPEKEEAALALSLQAKILAANNMDEARRLADELDPLPGDAATQAKLSLYLQPKTFDPFGVDVTAGLWQARNRQMVVARLESALVDPQQEVGAGTNLVALLTALKTRMQVPFDPANPSAPLSSAITDSIEAGYLHRLAQTLPERSGEAQVDAARTVLVESAGMNLTSGPDFEAAREVLITNFGLVNKWNVDWLLNSYGRYLLDVRMLPPLQRFLSDTSDPVFAGARAAVLAQMSRLQSDEVPRYLVHEACSASPAPMAQVRELVTEPTLPGADDCLRAKLATQAKAVDDGGRSFDLGVTMEYIARFATAALVPDVRKVYLSRTENWDQSAQGAAVTYLMRWDSKRSLPFLEALLPESDPYGGAMMFFLLRDAYPPATGLRTALRSGLMHASGRSIGSYAYALSQIGEPDDRQLIRERLNQLRTHNGRIEIDGAMEIDLIDAANHGLSWNSGDDERIALERTCITQECKKRFPEAFR